MSKKEIFICSADDMHPYNCDKPYGGSCVHCERKIVKGEHHPKNCALCDPNYDHQPNKYWNKKMNDREKLINLYTHLQRTSSYESPEKLRRSSETDFGLSYEEVLEMAYKNVIAEAKNASSLNSTPPSRLNVMN